jgi:hypothetical protein
MEKAETVSQMRKCIKIGTESQGVFWREYSMWISGWHDPAKHLVTYGGILEENLQEIPRHNLYLHPAIFEGFWIRAPKQLEGI